ncbi:hypothetical protein ACLKA7_010425 [Drosophila subpalustris]
MIDQPSHNVAVACGSSSLTRGHSLAPCNPSNPSTFIKSQALQFGLFCHFSYFGCVMSSILGMTGWLVGWMAPAMTSKQQHQNNTNTNINININIKRQR